MEHTCEERGGTDSLAAEGMMNVQFDSGAQAWFNLGGCTVWQWKLSHELWWNLNGCHDHLSDWRRPTRPGPHVAFNSPKRWWIFVGTSRRPGVEWDGVGLGTSYSLICHPVTRSPNWKPSSIAHCTSHTLTVRNHWDRKESLGRHLIKSDSCVQVCNEFKPCYRVALSYSGCTTATMSQIRSPIPMKHIWEIRVHRHHWKWQGGVVRRNVPTLFIPGIRVVIWVVIWHGWVGTVTR